MSDIKTVTLDGGEHKVEGLGGQNTVIVNRGSATLYASASANVTPDGDNTAAIPSGGVMNLYGTNGTVYLLGTGKVELEGTDYADIGRAAVVSSGGGSSGGGVSKEYVDDADAITLSSAKKYTDDEIAEVEGKIPVIPESLPADGGNAETAQRLETARNINGTAFDGSDDINVFLPNIRVMGADGSNGAMWFKFADVIFDISSRNQNVDCCFIRNQVNLDIDYIKQCTAIFNVGFRKHVSGSIAACFTVQDLAAGLSIDNFKFLYKVTDTQIEAALYVREGQNINSLYMFPNKWSYDWTYYNEPEGIETLPDDYTIVDCQYASNHEAEELADLKGYIGYTDSDIYGLEADFENNRFTRLAGAVGKNPGADFDSVNAFGGRRRCAVTNNGDVKVYYGDPDFNVAEDGYYDPDGVQTQIMVEQPKFYYKVVPLKTEKIDGANGYHLRKARYYISDTPKPGFKVHPAFIQNGVEVDKIYLSAYEGGIYHVADLGNGRVLNDEQIADFDVDSLCSTTMVKPASGTTQALTRDNARKLAQNRGAGWGITTIQTLSATQLLFAIEYATFNSQAAIGNGVVNAAETIRTGSTSSLGNASGSVESGGVSYRGEENLWGNIYKFIDGIYFNNIGDNSTMYISEKPIPIVKDSNKFPSAFQYTSECDWLFWPSEFTGNSSFLTGDIIVNSATGTSLGLMVGGRYSSATLSAGMFCDSVYSAGHSGDRGARLIYIPQPTAQEVTAND